MLPVNGTSHVFSALSLVRLQGEYELRVQSGLEDKCALLPIACHSALVSTSGFRWNLRARHYHCAVDC